MPCYGKLRSHRQWNIKKAGKARKGKRRYQCKTCGWTSTQTKGTILYRRRMPELAPLLSTSSPAFQYISNQRALSKGLWWL